MLSAVVTAPPNTLASAASPSWPRPDCEPEPTPMNLSVLRPSFRPALGSAHCRSLSLPRPLCLLALALGLTAQLSAQVAPSSISDSMVSSRPPPKPADVTAPSTDTHAPVVLSPFEVNTSEDKGFIATAEMAGTRLGTDLKDTPAPYSVLTRQLIQAFNINDASQAADFFVGSFNGDDNGTNQAFSIIQNYNIRGAAPTQAQYPTTNYFPENVIRDSYNVEQYEEGRGANSILFGSGPFSGNLNVATKQANPSHAFDEMQLEYGSFNFYRATVDVNQPIGTKAALRTDLLWQDNGTYQISADKKKNAAYLNAAFNVTPNTAIHLEGEYGENWTLRPNTEILDDVSGWDGQTTFASFNPALSIPTATRNTEGVSQYGSHFVYDPAGGTTNIVNYQNVPDTQSGSAVGQLIGGQPIVGAAIQGGAPFIGQNIPAGRFVTALAGSRAFYLPGRAWNNTYTGTPTFTQNYKDATLTIDQHFGDTWFFQLAGNLQKESSWGNNANGTNAEFIDINQTLPTGQANPEYLHPYEDIRRYDEPRWVDFRNLRFAAAWTKQLGRHRLTFNFLSGLQYLHTENRAYAESLPLTTDLRSIINGGAGNADVVFYRQYWDQPNRSIADFTGPVTVVNPQTGITQTVTPINLLDVSRTDNTASSHNNYKYIQAAGTAKLFDDKLVILGAVRRDAYYNITRGPIHPLDFPADWNGSTLIFKPDAPANYFNLTYLPKSATGQVTGPAQPALTRPRTSGVAQAQYANDVFQDDFNPPALRGAQNTASIGAVYNIKPWVGIYGNVGETFALPVPLISYQNTLLPNTAAHDIDGGVRFHLYGGRLEISLGGYRSTQNNAPVKAIGQADINPILALAPSGDANVADQNALGIPQLPTVIEDTISEKTEGVELEVTANLTRQWRLIFNLSHGKIFQSNADGGFLAYYNSHLSQLQQILKQGGLVYNSATNTYSADPAIPNPVNNANSQINNAITAWNNLQNTDLVNANIGQAQVPFVGARDYIGHLATDYTFDTGRLKGFLIGGALAYNGKETLGTTAGNTAVNPANPTGAGIQVGSPFQFIYSDPYMVGTGTLGYTFKVRDRHTVSLHLVVNNLFNYSQPIYYVSVQGGNANDLVSRAVGGYVASPARIQTPNQYTFVPPRGYNLSVTMDF